jgi:feruloyl esterase
MTNDAANFTCVEPPGVDRDFHDDDEGRGDDRK